MTSIERVIAHYASQVAPTFEEIARVISETSRALDLTEAWFKRFPSILKLAQNGDRTGLEPGEVWQKHLDEFLNGWTPIREKLIDAYENLKPIMLRSEDRISQPLGIVYGNIHNITIPAYNGYKAKITYGLSKPEFRIDPETNRRETVHSEDLLMDWSKAFSKWLDETKAELKSAKAKIRRISK